MRSLKRMTNRSMVTYFFTDSQDSFGFHVRLIHAFLLYIVEGFIISAGRSCHHLIIYSSCVFPIYNQRETGVMKQVTSILLNQYN